jgi:hypothetical protein
MDWFPSISPDDDELTAMAWYGGFFKDWRPEMTKLPTLFVTPTEPLPDPSGTSASDYPWQSSWPLPHTAQQVPGNHATMIEAHADATANVIDEWLQAAP